MLNFCEWLPLFLFQVLFCAGAVIVIGCATWFYFTPQSQRNMIYAPTIIMGAGNSMMLVTSLAMVADIIGDDKVGLPSQNISWTYIRYLSISLFLSRGSLTRYHLSISLVFCRQVQKYLGIQKTTFAFWKRGRILKTFSDAWEQKNIHCLF